MNRFDFLQAFLNEAVQNGAFPSAAAGIGKGDEIYFTGAAGQGNIDTIYDMASMSKVLSTTMVALRALEEGAITLYDTLSRFFDAPSDKKDISLFQLMTHTAGFEPFFLIEEEARGPEDVLRCLLDHPLDNIAPNTPSYSCLGYIVLGKVLETVYGRPLDELAQEKVFAPLGLTNTSYRPKGHNIAPTEVDPATGVAFKGIVHDENARFQKGISGNAGVFSTLGDCMAFCAMLSKKGGGFISAATLQKAITNYTPGFDVHRGLGFHLAGTPGNFIGDLFPSTAYGHTGFTGTSFVVDPQTGLYAVLLTNRVHPTRENGKILRLRRVFHNRVYAAFSNEQG